MKSGFQLKIGAKVAYISDGAVGEEGTPVGIIVNDAMVTMPDYTMPGPPPRGFKPGDDNATDQAWLVFFEDHGGTRVEAIWKSDTYLVEVPYDTQFIPLKPREQISGHHDAVTEALREKAISDIEWVIADLRSWETNPESCKYDADMLDLALTTLKTLLEEAK